MDELDVRIILALADNRMIVSEVAKAVFMHRNSVVHRIERINRITGLDPTDFWDLCKLVKMVGKGGLTMPERCVCCGEIIPEGRQVCPKCEGGADNA